MRGYFVRNTTKTITAQNTFSDFIVLKKGGLLTLEGTFTATISLQRRGSDGNIVDATNNSGTAITFTGPGTYTIDPQDFVGEYRFGAKTGNFTSGEVDGLLEGR
jgi:hypothetical protein